MRLDDRLKRAEIELCRYHQSIQRLNSLKQSIIEAGAQNDVGPVNVPPGDPTANRAAALVDNSEIARLEWIIETIKGLYESLSAERRRFVELRFWAGKPIDVAAGMLCISERTAYRWRDEIVEDLAYRLGW